jgi:hypothetical protein
MVMSGVEPRSSYRSPFRKRNILPIACQYILSYIYIAVVNLSCVQRGVSNTEVKIFNSLPSNIQSYTNDRKRFKNQLYRYLIVHCFYSITESLECKIDKDNI